MSSLIVEACPIESIEKHPNADRLSVVKVKGWHCIVGLDQYQAGDLVAFVPPDSIIPTDLIEKYNLEYLRNDGRVKTVKLRGFISQGLVLDLPDGQWQEGDNLADVLGITKWQPPERKSNGKSKNKVTRKKLNPHFDKYTDIENVKNYNRVFSPEDEVVITEKIHGSNFRCGRLPIVLSKDQPFLYRLKAWINKRFKGQTHEFVWGSHNVQLTYNSKTYYGDDIYSKIVKFYDLENIVPDDYIIYGEVYGKGVQDDLTYKNPYGFDGLRLAIFDIKVNERYLSWDEVVDFCYDFGLPYVPVLYRGSFSEDILDACTNGKSIIAPDQIREGCVVKPTVEEFHPKLGRKILKSISPAYLLRKGGTEYR